MQSVITAREVSFEFSNGFVLFRSLNFSLSSSVTALVGPNGVGKSTLARLLQGQLAPTTGTISRNRPVTLLLQREQPPECSVEEFLAKDSVWSSRRASLLAEIDTAKPCRMLSGGEWMRVRLARTLDDGFLILDEPTNDLDSAGRDIIYRFLSEHRAGALVISHDRTCLRQCDEILELSNRGLAKFGGSWDEYAQARANERTNLEIALSTAKRSRDAADAERNLQKERQEKRNRQGAANAARGGTPEILLGRRKRAAQISTGAIDSETAARSKEAIRGIHEAMQQIKADPVIYADLLSAGIPAGKLVAEARQFNVRHDRWVYPADLDFCWRGNVRIALSGPNGSGKSTLLNTLLEKTSPHETRGQLKFGRLTTLFIDQRCALLDDDKSILENVRDVSAMPESEVRSGLARFLFPNDSVFKKVKDLSGGERMRAALARGLLANTRPELLILDEPTNNLDLANIEFLENLVKEFRGPVVVVSHDGVFLRNCQISDRLELAGED